MNNNNSVIKEVDLSFFDDFLEDKTTSTETTPEVDNTEKVLPNVEIKKQEVDNTTIPIVDESFFLSGSTEKTNDVQQDDSTSNPDVDNQFNSSDLYLAQIEFYKTQGVLPEDFELEDGVELNEETFGEVLELGIANVKLAVEQEVREEYVAKLGDNLISFLENGGDYESFASLLKENVEINKLDITTEKGQKEIVRKYYENLGWSDTRIDKTIDRLLNDDDLQEEALNFKSALDEEHQKKELQLVKEQEKIHKKQIELENKQKQDFYNTLSETGLTKQESLTYLDFVYEPKYTLGNNTKETFTAKEVKLMQIEKDPKELAELVMFLNNKQEYLKRKAIELNNPKVDKTFKTIVKNQNNKTKGEAVQEQKNRVLPPFKLNF